MRNWVLRGAIAVAVVCIANADTTIEEMKPFGSKGEIEIVITSGSVTVEAWDEPMIQVTGAISARAGNFEFSIDDDDAKIRVVHPRNGKSVGSSKLLVRMPRTCDDLRIKVTSGKIDVRGIEGELTIESTSGTVDLADIKGEVRAQTVSGDLNIQGVLKECEAKVVSGDLVLRIDAGEVTAGTISGAILIEGNIADRLECSSVSGNVTYKGTVAKNADLELKSHSGNVTVALPADVSADFELQSFSGSIRNALSDDPVQRPPYGPGSSVEFSLHDGDASIEAETFSGNVTLTNR
ncbi:MAG TPA: DUF4097 family beta strand repeat-containing protein [Candidatus Hydrogenedentes bacterium]|nr:DUF4097 family beta strand repeat-containing protein [Candidatus Hydrogenedentota bacterium]